MTKIVLIDDDYASGILEEHLAYRGHDVSRYKSASEALGDLDKISDASLVILDIIMERPENLPTQNIGGGQSTGMVIYRELRSRKPELPILVLSATQDSHLVKMFLNDKKLGFYRSGMHVVSKI